MATKSINADQTRRMVVPFEVKSTGAGDGQFAGEFEGYAAGILNIDSTGDMILPGAFAEDLPRFLSEGVVCWQHDWMTPIGKPLEAREDGYGLFTKSRISKTAQGNDAMTLIRDGVVNKLSIGYRVQSYKWVDRAGLAAWAISLPPAKAADILRQFDARPELDGVYLLERIKLYEYSPVTVPANQNAIITGAKGLLAGLRLPDHSEAVRDAVADYAERVKGIVALRQAEGRSFKAAPDHIEVMRGIAGQLDQCARDLNQCCDDMAPEDPEEDSGKSARAALAEFLKLQARQIGCAV